MEGMEFDDSDLRKAKNLGLALANHRDCPGVVRLVVVDQEGTVYGTIKLSSEAECQGFCDAIMKTCREYLSA